MSIKKPTAAENEYADYAVRMLLYIECLPFALCDLRAALFDSGRLKHEPKLRIGQVENIVTRVTDHSYWIFRRIGLDLSRQYIDRMEALYSAIDDSVDGDQESKYLNILGALCSLIEEYNKKLSTTYYFERAEPVYHIMSLLSCVGAADRIAKTKSLIEQQRIKL